MTEQRNTLADLVAKVLQTQAECKLDAAAKDLFHKEFEGNISEEVGNMRAAKRRAYEELKNVAIR